MPEKILVPYTLSDGTIIEVEVSEEVAETLAGFKREDESYRRKMRRHNLASLDEIMEQSGWEPLDLIADVEYDYILKEEWDELRVGISKLKPNDQEFINAIYFDEVTVKDYAARKNISLQAVYKRLEKIYKQLKNILTKKVEK